MQKKKKEKTLEETIIMVKIFNADLTTGKFSSV